MNQGHPFPLKFRKNIIKFSRNLLIPCQKYFFHFLFKFQFSFFINFCLQRFFFHPYLFVVGASLPFSGSLLVSHLGHLQSTLFLCGGLKPKLPRGCHCRSCVVELRSMVYDVNICHRTNLIWLRFLSLSEYISTAFFILFTRLQDIPLTYIESLEFRITGKFISKRKNIGAQWASNHGPEVKNITKQVSFH